MSSHELQPIAPRRPGLVAVDGRTYPLESLRLEGRAEGGIAFTRVIQKFANRFDEPLEVIYTLPLPADGAVLGYSIRMGEKTIRGEIQPREKAAKAYRDALYEGRTAGLLEQDRADSFSQRLGNVPPRTEVEVAIDVLQTLLFLSAIEPGPPQWEYRFPTVVGIRYEGAPGRVPDADRLDVERDADGGIPTRFQASLEIAGTIESAEVSSPSHELVLDRKSETRLVRLSEDQRLDRDLVVRWAACAPEASVRLVEGGGLEGDEGRYALVTVVPPRVASAALHRDLTVLIDASGSMSGEPIDLAKRVVAELLSSLDPEDRFELIAFANEPKRLTRGLTAASPKLVAEARKALQGLSASGGTEMLNAVEKALAPLRRDAQRQVVLVTDGQIGFEHDVVSRIAAESRSGVRVHAIGIGSAPNRALLRGVAAAGRGIELIASDLRGAEEAAQRLRAATVRPVLTDLAVRGAAVRDVAPERPRDLCAGQPLVLSVELTSSGGDLVVTGRTPGSSDAWTWTTTVPAKDSAEPRAVTPMPVGALFGRAEVEELELYGKRQQSDRDKAVLACALRHRIVSRMTSLVAIAEEPSVDPRAPRRRERLALEMPYGVSAEGTGMFHAAGGQFMGAATMQLHLMPRSALVSLSRGFQPTFRLMQHEEQTLRASLVRLQKDLMVLEVEVTEEGPQPPQGVVDVLLDLGDERVAEYVPDESSTMETAAKGTLVRMGFRLKGGDPWPNDRVVLLRWGDGRAGGKTPIEWTLVVDLSRVGDARAR